MRHNRFTPEEVVSPQRPRHLAQLRRVRDRIHREYGQPLDVEALARGAHMSAGHPTDQESRSAGRGATPSMTVMDITIHQTFLPLDDPDASLAFYRDTLGFQVRNDVEYGGMRWTTVRSADQPGTSIDLEPPTADPGITDDEHHRRYDAKAATPASRWPPPTWTVPSRGCRPAAPTSSRSRSSSRMGFATAPSAIPSAT